jgi:hypothetical protein
MSSPSSTPTVTAALIQELLEKHGETLLQGLAKMLQSSGPASAPAASGGKAAKAPKTAKKTKAASEDSTDAEPKEKRPPNAWILFSARVEKLVRAAEEAAGTPKESAMKTVVCKQFASHLKSQKAYEEWADSEITEAMASWTPPEVSKQALAKAEKEASESGSVADASEAPAPKPKRVMSEEAKAAAAAKRAATNAAKKAAEASAAPAADAAPAEAAEAAPAPTKKAIAIKPKKAAPAPEPAKNMDLSFFAWTHDGTDYYTNDRGDVVTTDWEWVGRFNGSVIDETVPEADDLSEATLRD